MAKKDNPVGRLYEILVKAKQFTGTGYEIWGQVFEIESVTGDSPDVNEDAIFEVLSRIVQLRALVNEAKESLMNLEGVNHELYLTPFPNIIPVVKIDNFPTSNFELYIQKINESDMALLSLGADELSRRHIEPSINEDELKEILREVNELFEEVSSSSLEKELKTYILTQLELIRRGINEYRITGIKRLQEALATTIGSMLINRDLINQASDKQEVGKFVSLTMRFANVVTLASKATALIESLSKFLPLLLPGGPHS